MSDTNVGMGMVPHKATCGCDDCTIDNLRAKRREQDKRIAGLEAMNTSLETENKKLHQYAVEQSAYVGVYQERIRELEARQQDWKDDRLASDAVIEDLRAKVAKLESVISNQHDEIMDQKVWIGELQDSVQDLEAENAELRAALVIADQFCATFSADDCPDSVAIPIKAALRQRVDQQDGRE